ncbi:hypothetical protein [Bifidobacterium criceti]|nr:hypothetical protein [Bifidobacterium criceti]
MIMNKPFITEEEFLELGRTEIDTPKALAEALHTLRPQMTLTEEGAGKLYRNIQLSLFATRLAGLTEQTRSGERERCKEIAGWLDNGFPTFRYGHAGNFLVPDPKDDFAWDLQWDNIEDPSEADKAHLHHEYETLCNEGALSSPIMLIQINWSGNGSNENEPFWGNILSHRGIKHMAGRLPQIWHTIVENGYEDTFRGAYMTDFYKPFPTPKSDLFEKTFRKATLDSYLDDNSAIRAKWNNELDNSDYASVRRFDTLVAGTDFTGDAAPQLDIMTLLQMAMFIQLCEEAKLLHIEHPIMVPWGQIPKHGLEASVPAAEASEAFPLPDELPFLDGKSAKTAFTETYMQHNSLGNGHMGNWLKTTACNTFTAIQTMEKAWEAKYGNAEC